MRILAVAAAVVMVSLCSSGAAWAAFPQIGFPGLARTQSDDSWQPIDRVAERVFHEADANHDDLLNATEVRHAQKMLHRRLKVLVQRGAMRHIPPMALNGQAHGVKLPGQEQASRPEFVLYARSLAIRMANSPAAN